MGAWGAGLYEDDFAVDLRDSIALVSKVPGDGVRLTEILLDIHKIDSESEDETIFWLVTADQFERRGIECPSVFTTALSLIESGADLERLRHLDADERFLRKRASVLGALASRLAAPRPLRARTFPKKPPDAVLHVGQVFAFPTMNGYSCGPYWPSTRGRFEPNGWGALVVLASGRAFDWIPWCALASLTVDATRKPTLEDALGADLIFHLQTDGAARCVPRRADCKTMRLELLGEIALDPSKVQPHLSKWSVASAIECSWSIAYAGYAATVKCLPIGPALQSLVHEGVYSSA